MPLKDSENDIGRQFIRREKCIGLMWRSVRFGLRLFGLRHIISAPCFISPMAPRSDDSNQLHFLLIPLLSQSHIIPLTDFAKLLAQRGQIVSIITTPVNSQKYKQAVHQAVESGRGIQMISLEFPGREVGLPPGCENLDSIPSVDSFTKFFQACEMMKTPLVEMIPALDPMPNCIVSTNALAWTQEVADRFKIPRYIFETISCFTLFCSGKIARAQIQDIPESEWFLVPGIPNKIEFTKAQLPEASIKLSKDIMDQIVKSRDSARGTVVNSFEELEQWYAEEYRKERNIWCIGPVSLCDRNLDERSHLIEDHPCIYWLDSMNPGSVVYVCFGSLCRISVAQIKQIGLGLETSNFPFIWIIRGLDCSEEVEKWLSEENYEHRVEGRGLIIRGWAPQVRILLHPSVGGFLTHSGWNSTLEGVSAGLPMITWPMFAEQFYNEKFIVDVLKTGVKVGARALVKPGAVEDEEKGFVTLDQVKKSIEMVMDEDEEEGKERRRRAKMIGEMAQRALAEGGSSDLNMNFLIQDVLYCSNHISHSFH